MTALAAAALAMSVQAASFVWKTSTTGKVYQPGSSTTLASGTAYIFDESTVSQANLFAALIDGTDISTLGALDSSSVTKGTISAKTGEPFSWTGTGDLNVYFAIVDGGNFYISTIQSGTPQDVGATQISFKEASASKAALKVGAMEFTSAGWYTAVPEPTSGILMLVGLAGLALRRRRA